MGCAGFAIIPGAIALAKQTAFVMNLAFALSVRNEPSFELDVRGFSRRRVLKDLQLNEIDALGPLPRLLRVECRAERGVHCRDEIVNFS